MGGGDDLKEVWEGNDDDASLNRLMPCHGSYVNAKVVVLRTPPRIPSSRH